MGNVDSQSAIKLIAGEIYTRCEMIANLAFLLSRDHDDKAKGHYNASIMNEAARLREMIARMVEQSRSENGMSQNGMET